MGLKKLTGLVDCMEECELLLKHLETFTALFYDALIKNIRMIMVEMKNRGLIQEPQAQPHWSGGLQPFRLQWGRNQLTVVPIIVPALADPHFLVAETFALPENIRDDLVGRLVLVYQPVGNGMTAIPMGEVYVFSNNIWCTSGNIPPVRQNAFEKHLIEDFALLLLEGLTYGMLDCFHQSLQETVFDSESQNIPYPIDVDALQQYRRRTDHLERRSR
ncbi:MAG: hypothetical protein GY801_20360 [bacterium]|nr:hypothetical protein [bacterium]